MQLFSNQPSSSQIPSFVALVGLLGPLLGIAFGFDAINGERAERTLSRLVAQPIHRDDVINGKFAAGLAMIGLVLLAITMLVSGVAFFVLGIQPSPDDLARLAVWYVVTLVYLGFWLAFAMLCSVVLRRAATSALAAIGLWIVLTLFTALLVGIVAGYVAPVSSSSTVDQQIANVQTQLDLSRVSPGTLYGESSAYLLNPTVQTVGIIAHRPAGRPAGAAVGPPVRPEPAADAAAGGRAAGRDGALFRGGLRRLHAPGGPRLALPVRSGQLLTMRAVTMPNMPCMPSACGRMWQWKAHAPGLSQSIRTS